MAWSTITAETFALRHWEFPLYELQLPLRRQMYSGKTAKIQRLVSEQKFQWPETYSLLIRYLFDLCLPIWCCSTQCQSPWKLMNCWSGLMSARPQMATKGAWFHRQKCSKWYRHHITSKWFWQWIDKTPQTNNSTTFTGRTASALEEWDRWIDPNHCHRGLLHTHTFQWSSLAIFVSVSIFNCHVFWS